MSLNFVSFSSAQDSRILIGDPSALGLGFLGHSPGAHTSATIFDIAAPDSGDDVSYNRHDAFGVTSEGFIYNNSVTGGMSVLGRHVTANPNLVADALPSVIISEVAGGSSSMLAGKIEVFGSPADVVITNAYGITCDGCEFINADDVELSSWVIDFGGSGTIPVPSDPMLSRVTIGSGGLTSDSAVGIYSDFVDINGDVTISDSAATESLGFVVETGWYEDGFESTTNTLTVAPNTTISAGHVYMGSWNGSVDIGGWVIASTGVKFRVDSGNLTYNNVTSNWFNAEAFSDSLAPDVGYIYHRGNVHSYDVDIYGRAVDISGVISAPPSSLNPADSFFGNLYDGVYVDIIGLDSFIISSVVDGYASISPGQIYAKDIHISSNDLADNITSHIYPDTDGGLWLNGFYAGVGYASGDIPPQPTLVVSGLATDNNPLRVDPETGEILNNPDDTDAAPPILNIAPPHAGVSLNRFLGTEIGPLLFNADNTHMITPDSNTPERETNPPLRSLILNASSTPSTSLDGFLVPANPLFVSSNIQDSDVNLIVIEVISNESTSLRSAVELVGGSRLGETPGTSLIFSNPNRITCLGCSFHNFRSVKLTTGRIVLNNSRLLGSSSSDTPRTSAVDILVDGGFLQLGSEGTASFHAVDGSAYLSAGNIHIDGPILTGAHPDDEPFDASQPHASEPFEHNLFIEGGRNRIEGYDGYVDARSWIRSFSVSDFDSYDSRYIYGSTINMTPDAHLNVSGLSFLGIRNNDSYSYARLAGEITGSHLYPVYIHSAGDLEIGSVSAGRVRILARGDVTQYGSVDAHSYRVTADSYELVDSGVIRVGSTAMLANDNPDPTFISDWERDPETRLELTSGAVIAGEVTGVGVKITAQNFIRTASIRDDDGGVELNDVNYANDSVPLVVGPISEPAHVITMDYASDLTDNPLVIFWTLTLSRRLIDFTDPTEFDFSFIASDIPGFTPVIDVHEIGPDPLNPDSGYYQYEVIIELTPSVVPIPPTIEIETPVTSDLISYNRFDVFNVEEAGAILNNSLTDGTSELGIHVLRNLKLSPNLFTENNPASTILVETTGIYNSNLAGPLEVFGGKADLVIVNPNGISCNGCSFINTDHVTLTTGALTFDSSTGDITLMIDGGLTSIGASGLTGDHSLRIFSRFVDIDGDVTLPASDSTDGYIGLHGGDNHLGSYDPALTGSVSYYNTQTAGPDMRPPSTLDAVHISEGSVLTGSWFGATSSESDLDIVIAGEVRVGSVERFLNNSYGGIFSEGDIWIDSTGVIESTSGDLNLESDIDIFVDGDLVSSGDVDLKAEYSIITWSDSVIEASDDIHLESRSPSDRNSLYFPLSTGEEIQIGGSLTAGDDLDFVGLGGIFVAPSGRLSSGDDIDFNLSRVLRVAGEIIGGDDIDIRIRVLTSSPHDFGNLVVLDGGLLRSDGDDVRLDVAGKVDVMSGGRIESSDDIRGSVRGDDGLVVRSGGVLRSDDDIRLSVSRVLLVEGDDATTAELDRGVIRAGDDVRISSDSYDIFGEISSYDKLRLSSRSILEVGAGGLVSSDTDDVRLSGTNGIIVSGEVRGYDDLKFYSRRGSIDVRSGGIVAAVNDDISLRSFGSLRILGMVSSSDRGSISVRSGDIYVPLGGELRIGGTHRFRIGNETRTYAPSDFGGDVVLGGGV